jgi:polysaccharide deacetylase 2 family uncharacterized protein YibQ
MKTSRKNPLKSVFSWLSHHRGLVASLLLLMACGTGGHMLRQQTVRDTMPEVSSAPSLPVERQEMPVQAPDAQPELPPDIIAEKQKARRPRIVIMIDDMGLDQAGSQRAINLPGKLTLSFLPYAPGVQKMVDRARAQGHAIFLHLPMQPGNGESAGPHMLRTGLGDDEIRALAARNLDVFTGYEGVNNHMGSGFTSDEHAMRVFLNVMQERKLIFLDSRTTPLTKFPKLCVEMGMPCLRRHVFLDHIDTRDNVKRQLDELLKLARRQGYAVAIGHPYKNTLDSLETFLPYFVTQGDLVSPHDLLPDLMP